MAKRLGYSVSQIRSLSKFRQSGEFEAKITAALDLAEKMTLDPHAYSDADLAGLRAHYSEPEIVELGCVIGLANYFNRFTTTFRVDLSGSNAPYDSFVPDFL